MDEAEKHVEQYLRRLGFKDIVHEPDGNVPPDFLVNGDIAIEVRRLNQNHITSEGYEGLEQLNLTLYKMIERECERIPAIPGEPVWFLVYEFERPLDHRPLKKLVRSALAEADMEGKTGLVDILNIPNFKLQAAKGSSTLENKFRPGIISDHDSGGFIGSMVIDNLILVLKEKSKKIEPYRAKYKEWWLIVFDQIGTWLSEDASHELPTRPEIEAKCSHSFDRVIAVDSRDYRKSWEL
jgi:hypothetical protein